MDMDELTRLAVHEIARRLQRRLLSPVDLVEASLARIAAQEPRLHAYTEVYAQDARLAARGADAVIRSGHAVGPPHGVPIALKDLVELEGKLVTGGSEAWQARRAPTTALPLDEVDQTQSPAHFTRFANFLDLTALSLPNGADAAGLPTSLQVVCRGCDEATALRIGWDLQQATDWYLRHPPD